MDNLEIGGADIDFTSREGAKLSDYSLDGKKIPKPAFRWEDKNIAYNQRPVSLMSCTVVGAATALSNLLGNVFSQKDLESMWKDAKKAGASDAEGFSMGGGVDVVRNWWNSRHDQKVLSFRVNFAQEKHFELLDLGYMLAYGFRGNSAWNKDKNDGRLDGLLFPATTYGHILSHTNKDINDTLSVDNYKGYARVNEYLVEKINLAKIRNFFNSAYVFMIESDYILANKLNPVISSWAEASKEKAIKSGIIKDWTNPQEKIGGEKLEWILENAGVLDRKQHEGFVTLEQFAVVLDRLNLLN
jgi:hypothetical protein